MNYGSPLNKDQKVKKTEEQPKKVKKPTLSRATAKKILQREVGQRETDWLNRYVENLVQSSSLPLSVLSNGFLSEMVSVFGEKGAAEYQQRIIADYERQCPKIS